MNAEGSGSLFDAHPHAFGSMEVRGQLDGGRHGPVFLGHDPDTDRPVVVRTFEPGLDPAQRALLLDALRRACDAPLQHVSIGRPIACGVDHDLVYVVHSYLPGQPADEWVRAHGPRPLADLMLLVAKAAAAIDFAAAAGVHHGALTARDVLVDGDTAGVTGWGIEQARAAAGLAQAAPSHAGDIAAFASVVFALLAEPDATRVAGVFERAWSSNADDRPATALEFAGALQQAAVAPVPAAAAPPAPAPDLPFLQPFDAPLRAEEPPAPNTTRLLTFDASPADTSDAPSAPVPDAAPGPAFDASRPMFDATRTFTVREHSPSRWPALAGVAVITLAVGFAGGLLVGRQERANTPAAPAPPVAAATSGRAFTDAPVPAPDAAPQPAPPQNPGAAPAPAITEPLAEPSAGPAARPAPQARSEPPPRRAEAAPRAPAAASSEATLQVDSRPRGAQVYVDGRLVGRTPTIAGGLRPGQHAVRLEMSGYRRWATAVMLAGGEHARVGGSLEEQ